MVPNDTIQRLRHSSLAVNRSLVDCEVKSDAHLGPKDIQGDTWMLKVRNEVCYATTSVAQHTLRTNVDDSKLSANETTERHKDRISMGDAALKAWKLKIDYLYKRTLFNTASEDLEGQASLDCTVLDFHPNRATPTATMDDYVTGTFSNDPRKSTYSYMGAERAAKKLRSEFMSSAASRCHLTQLIGLRLRRLLRQASVRSSLEAARFLQYILADLSVPFGHLYQHLIVNDVPNKNQGVSRSDMPCIDALIKLIYSAECQVFKSSSLALRRLARLNHVSILEELHDIPIHFDTLELVMDPLAFMNSMHLYGSLLASNVRLFHRLINEFESFIAMNGDLGNTCVNTFIGTCIFPGLGLIKLNPTVIAETTELVQRLSFSQKTLAFSQAASISKHRFGAEKALAERARTATHRILRRLSLENAKDLGRKVGKLMNSFPFLCSSIILDQVEAYPNMIPCIVQSLKYCGSLSLDAMVFLILERLSSKREKVKGDGQHMALWYTSLCQFTGLLSRCHKHVDLLSILCHIIIALRHGDNFEILVLKEVVKQTAEIDLQHEMSDSRLMSICGGDRLKSFYDPSRSEADVRKRLVRLKHVLDTRVGDHQLCVTLLLSLLACRQNVAFDLSSDQIKFISQCHDDTHFVFMQYVLLLQSVYSRTAYSDIVRCALESPCCLSVDRTLVSYLLGSLMRNGSDDNACHYFDERFRYFAPSGSVSLPVPLHKQFWKRGVEEIFVSSLSYDEAIKRLESDAGRLETMLSESTAGNDIKVQLVGTRRKLKELSDEYSTLRDTAHRNRQSLIRSLQIVAQEDEIQCISSSVLYELILPRVRLSKLDAVFSFQFVQVLHEAEVGSFNSFIFHEKLFQNVAPIMNALSHAESKCFGVFLSRTLEQLSLWRKRSAFEEFCANNVVFKVPAGKDSKCATHVEFLNISYNWHIRLTKAALRHLSGRDYATIRNTLEVLVHIVDEFPRTMSHGVHLLKCVHKLAIRDSRADVRTFSTRYMHMLKFSRKSWICEDEFHGLRI